MHKSEAVYTPPRAQGRELHHNKLQDDFGDHDAVISRFFKTSAC